MVKMIGKIKKTKDKRYRATVYDESDDAVFMGANKHKTVEDAKSELFAFTKVNPHNVVVC